MNSPKPCPDLREKVAALVLGQLPGIEATVVHTHMATCEGCRELYKAMMREESMIRSTFAMVAHRGKEMEPQLVRRVRNTRAAQRPMPLAWLHSRLAVRIATLAAAAALILGAVVLVRTFTDRPQTVPLVTGQGAQPPVEGAAGQGQPTLDQELARTRELYAVRDQAGLIAMLDSGQWQTKIAAAGYLGQIGDAAAAASLGKCVGQWTGPAAENPFAKAIGLISQRTAAARPQPQSMGQVQRPADGQQRGDGAGQPGGSACPLRGRITDAVTGEPVTDARIEIILPMTGIPRARVDANGYYRFDKIEKDGSYRVKIYSRGHIGITEDSQVPSVDLRTGTEVVRDFQLRKACRIEVTVVDEQDRPIKGAVLTVSSLADAYGREIGEGRAATDANGIVRLGGLSPSDQGYQIIATHEVRGPLVRWSGMEISRSSWDYAPGHLVVTPKDPNVVETGRIVLTKGVDVKGYCDYADGVPATGLNISANPEWMRSAGSPMIEIDPNGEFTLPQIVPGKYLVRVSIPRGDGMSLSLEVGQMEWPSAEIPFHVRVPQKSPLSLAAIAGRITYVGKGRPPRLEITATSPGLSSETINLQPGEQVFTISSLEPGAYTLRFQGQGIQEKVVSNVRAPISDLEVQLVYADDAKPVLQGTVTRADTGRPVTRFQARLAKVQHLRGVRYEQTDRWAEFASDKGQFSIEAVGPGVYQVQVAAEGLASAWSDKINTDENHPMAMVLTSGGSITGMVLDEQGRPVAGALVVALSRACGTSSHVRDVFVSTEGAVKTDAKGAFVLATLPAGRESIKVRHEGYCYAVKRDILVEEGRTTAGVDVVLSAGGIVEGQVYDSQGRPEAGVTLYAQDAGGYLMSGGDELAGRLATAVTDANGFYQMRHLPEQICTIQRSNTWSSLGVVRRSFMPRNGATRRLDLGGEPRVTGRLVLDGGLQAGVKVVLGDVLSYSATAFQCTVTTDGQGSFAFPGVPAGRYGIYYESPAKRNEWIKVKVIDTQGQDMNVGVLPGPGTEVRIHVKNVDPTKAGQGQPSSVILQDGTGLWASQTGSVLPPSQPGGPYVARAIQAGTHTVVVALANPLVRVRQKIVVPEGQTTLDVAVSIPAGTAAITGDLQSDGQQIPILLRADGSLMAYVYSGEGPGYRIEGLPAGVYHLCCLSAQDRIPLSTFTLAEGETKVMDVDMFAIPPDKVGLLWVQAVGTDGMPLTASVAWLETGGQRIDPVATSSEGHPFAARPGAYILHVTCAGYHAVAMQVEVKPGDINVAARQYKKAPIVVQLQGAAREGSQVVR